MFTRRFGTFLVAWTVLSVAMFLLIQVMTDAGHQVTEMHHLWEIWHPYWYGVLAGTCTIIPMFVFYVPAARELGGWHSTLGRICILLAASVACWGVIGNGVWFWYNSCPVWPAPLDCSSSLEAPFPSLADVGYLTNLPMAGWALIEMCRLVSIGRATLIRSAILLGLPLAIITAYFMVPTVHILGFAFGKGALFSSDYSLVGNLIASLYLTTEVVLISLAAMILASARNIAGSRILAPVVSLIVAFIGLWLGDLIFYSRNAAGTYYNGDVSDLAYTVFVIGTGCTIWLLHRAVTSELAVETTQ